RHYARDYNVTTVQWRECRGWATLSAGRSAFSTTQPTPFEDTWVPFQSMLD
ncbi:hypothetical protein J6590_105630, partial [Homalodisca vitripennis]